MAERTYILKGFPSINFLGSNDRNLRILQKIFPGKIVVRGNNLTLIGDKKEIDKFETGLKNLLERAKAGEIIDISSVEDSFVRKNNNKVDRDSLTITTPKRKIYPKTDGQRIYLKAIDKNDIVICIGPAGTGKTYLAVAKAIQYLVSKKYERIVLVRPAVEAGESLGFLPGDFKEKIDPYLRPLYDALMDMVPRKKLSRLYDTQTVEIAPLAFMRGRTLNDSFVILDEAQNSTSVQMKMFLTRLGNGSKAIVTGDITQIDLSKKEQSGLVQIQNILEGVNYVRFIYLTKEDVVRRKLVQEIVEAYERYTKDEN